MQPLWGFDGLVPGPLYVERYGRPVLVRNHNNLPANNGGFGKNLVTTHLHNGHTPAESDGNPCDFFTAGQFYDQHYPNVLAGVNSTHQDVGGDVQESMSTLWYHDHMHDFTSQNVYKGLAGMYVLFNDHDTGDETTGFHLPSFGDGVSDDSNFDVPMLFSDHLYDSETGIITFDTFNFDGVLGDRFLVERQSAAGDARASAALSFPLARRWSVTLLSVLLHRYEQSESTNQVSPDFDGRQSAPTSG